MRYIIIILFAFQILTLTACKKSDSMDFYLKAYKNGSNLTLSPYTGFKPLITKDTLVIVARCGEENIVLFIKNNGLGTYHSSDIKAYHYTTVGLDAVVSKYALNNNATNTIVLTQYDDVVTGTFNLNLSKTSGDANYADNLTLSNGTFRAKISNTYLDPYK